MRIQVFLIAFFISAISVFAQSSTNEAVQEQLDELKAKKILELEKTSAGGLRAIGIFTGYLDERMRLEKDHRGMSFLVSLGYNAQPFFSKFGIQTKGRIDFIVEPFFNTIFNPTNEVEIGSNFLIEYDFPLSKRLQPYIKGGLGLVYMTQQIKEQATQWNILPQGSVGFHLYLKDNIALSCEYRHRHLSNASIKKPNKGIDAKQYLVGLTFFFE